MQPEIWNISSNPTYLLLAWYLDIQDYRRCSIYSLRTVARDIIFGDEFNDCWSLFNLSNSNSSKNQNEGFSCIVSPSHLLCSFLKELKGRGRERPMKWSVTSDFLLPPFPMMTSWPSRYPASSCQISVCPIHQWCSIMRTHQSIKTFELVHCKLASLLLKSIMTCGQYPNSNLVCNWILLLSRV